MMSFSGMSSRYKQVGKQFVSFVGVGVLNTIFGYGVFAVFYLILGSHRAAIVIATVIGVVFNYFTIGRIVFKGSGLGVFVRFLLTYAIICLINIALLDLGARLDIPALVGQVLALGVLVPLSFAMNRRFVFGVRS